MSSYRNASGFHPPLSDLAAFSYGLIGVSLPFFGRKLKLNRYLQPSIGRIGNCAFAFGGHDSRGHHAALIGALTRARASSAQQSAPTGAEAERPHRPTHRTASHRTASHRPTHRTVIAHAGLLGLTTPKSSACYSADGSEAHEQECDDGTLLCNS